MLKPDSGPLMQVIAPKKGLLRIDWGELWQYRELFFFLVWRDIKVKYKQSMLGITWAILVPLVQMVIFTIIFGRLAKVPTDGLNPTIFYYAGLLPWNYFATSLTFSSKSLVTSANYLKKIYFPRIIIPSAPCIAAFVDFIVAFSIVIIMMIYYGIGVDFAVVFLPFLMLIAFGTAIGSGLFLSAINVKYRDVTHVIPFLVQIWMYASVIFPFSRIPESWGIWRYAYGLNPMAGVVEGFRWCLLHTQMFMEKTVGGETVKVPVDAPLELIGIGAASMLVMLIIGLTYFSRKEESFPDVV